MPNSLQSQAFIEQFQFWDARYQRARRWLWVLVCIMPLVTLAVSLLQSSYVLVGLFLTVDLAMLWRARQCDREKVRIYRAMERDLEAKKALADLPAYSPWVM